MKEEPRCLTLAKIIRPRGNKGEVAAESFASDLRSFPSGGRAMLRLADRTEAELEIDRAWEHKGRVILKFVGVDSISEAERLRSGEVLARKDALAPLPDGEYYFDDLIGCRMVVPGNERVIGIVTAIEEPPGAPLLFVVEDAQGAEMLVPFAREVCTTVDIGRKRIEVRLPEGLEDLKT